jgi:beta-lactamase class A
MRLPDSAISRRTALFWLSFASGPVWPAVQATESLQALEKRIGGRLGVFALNTSSGRFLEHRPDERFAMCSTFKWLLAAQLLAQVDRGLVKLSDYVSFGPADLLEYAPVTRRHKRQGKLQLRQLAEAAVTVSDNTAANLLLRKLGGPATFTSFARSLGDSVTRLDRIEPNLNSNDPNDERDTTTPRGMVTSLQGALLGDALSQNSKSVLLSWLRACETGTNRLRAGFPSDWRVGDKTGTGSNSAVNDVAIAEPPRGKAILVASYLSESSTSMESLNAAHAEVGKLVASHLGE